MSMDSLVAQIKDKRELRSLPDPLVEKTLKDYLAKNKLKLPKAEKEIKLILKEVRAELRRYTGQYTLKSNIKHIKEILSSNNLEDLLKEHRSTKERIQDYPIIKQIINNLNPKSILDLGCGINPIAIAKKAVRYHAYDINDADLHIVREFFKQNKIEGDTHHLDIRTIEVFPKVDLCIIFKVLDILGEQRNEVTEHLLKVIEAKHFLISFSTVTLSGRPMNSPYRRWFERILKELNYHYDVKRTSQELLYLIKKSD